MRRKIYAVFIMACVICTLVTLGIRFFTRKSADSAEEAIKDSDLSDSMTDESSSDRFIRVGDLKNARQLGGYIGIDDRRVKDGLLIRTERLDKLSDEAAADLANRYSVQYVVDFRMEYERSLAADKEIPGAQNEWISVYQMDMSDPENVALMKRISEAEGELQKSVEYAKTGQLSTLYTDILLSESGQKGYSRFFEILLDADGAVLWHCTHGKDRTGVAAALVLYALGVDEDVIMQDFLLTNEVYRENIERTEAGLKEGGYDDAIIKEAQAMAGVKGEYLEAAFEAVKKKYGSIEDYIRNQLGGSDEKLQMLREKYLENII